MLSALAGCAALDDERAATLAASRTALESCHASFDSLAQADQAQRAELAVMQDQLLTLTASTESLAETCATPVVVTPPPEPAPPEPTPSTGKLVVGSKENVWVEDLQLALPARIDTGAETASLDARNIEEFERDGDPWVRFDIPNPNSEEPITLERPRIRQALVIQASSEEPERRPVISLGIQLGEVRQLAEFTLSNRSHLDFQMLVGRNILRDVMIVDVSEDHLIPLPPAKQPLLETAAP
ncbi:MAG: RimK/LysX family protein [Pseudomonadota bacterium]